MEMFLLIAWCVSGLVAYLVDRWCYSKKILVSDILMSIFFCWFGLFVVAIVFIRVVGIMCAEKGWLGKKIL